MSTHTATEPALTTHETGPMLRRLLAVAFPMVVSQASETVMMFVDRLFLSRVGQLHLSAALSGGLTTFTVASVFVGIAGYVNAIVAQYYGAGRRENCARATAQAVYFSLAAIPILAVIAIVVPGFFSWIGHDPGQVPLESVYAQWLISGAVILLLRNGLSGFFLGIGKTRVVMLSNIAALSNYNPSRRDFRWLRDRMRSNVPGDGSNPRRTRRLYISRQNTVRGRKIANFDAVCDVLDRYDFERHTLEDYSFQRQLELFDEAQIIMGPHGAGLLNAIFAENPTVVELFPENIVKPHFYYLSNMFDFEYRGLVTSSQGENLVVDVDRVERLLAEVTE